MRLRPTVGVSARPVHISNHGASEGVIGGAAVGSAAAASAIETRTWASAPIASSAGQSAGA